MSRVLSRTSRHTALIVAVAGIAAACSAPNARADEAIPAPVAAALKPGAPLDTAIFAGGCFWGVEAVYRHTKGVVRAISGFAGGDGPAGSYENVSTGRTGHAESVEVIYDPAQVSYGTLLQIFFSVAHDPTQLNRQGPDFGTQYRSAIFTRSDQQEKVAKAYIAQLDSAHVFDAPIVTEVGPSAGFYEAEAYHQNYLARHRNQPYIMYNDLPKLDALKERFPRLYHETGIAAEP